MAKYTVLAPLHHNGKPYTPGETVELDAKQASALPDGVVEPAASEKPVKKGSK